MILPETDFLKLHKSIIGMVHLPPLPGAPSYSGDPIEKIVDFGVGEAQALEDGGVDAILVENFHDYPYPPDRVPTPTLIAMATIAYEVKKVVSVPIGVNLLFNDTENEMYLAWCLGLDFIRVEGFVDLLLSDMGILFPKAPDLMRLRHVLNAESVAILADVQGKYTHVLPERSVLDSAKDAFERGGAGAVILTGGRTGEAAPLETIELLKNSFPEKKVFLGSGITPDNLLQLLTKADGVIVGSYFKKDGRVDHPIDSERVKTMMRVAQEVRGK